MSDGLIVKNTENSFSSKNKSGKFRKAFIYLAPFIEPDTPFMEDNSHVTITLQPIVNDKWKAQQISIMTLDENDQVVVNGKKNNQSAKKLRVEHILNAYTDDFQGTAKDSEVWFATLDEPFDETKNQVIYRLDNISTNADYPEVADGLLNPELSTNFTLISSNKLEDEFVNLRIYFTSVFNTTTLMKKLVLVESQYKKLSTIEVDGKIKVSTTVNGKTTEKWNNYKEQLSIKDQKNYFPFIENIASLDNEIISYLPALDRNFSAPFNLFTNNQALTTFFDTPGTLNDILGNFTANIKNDYFPRTAKELIADLLMLSYSVDSKFPFADLVKDGNSAGAIKGDQWICYDSMQIATIQNKTAKELNDGRIRRFIKLNNWTPQDNRYKTLKQVINALSEYIPSSWSTSGGDSQFGRVYNYGYLTIEKFATTRINRVSPIDLTTQVRAWVLDIDNTKFKFGSSYFNGSLPPRPAGGTTPPFRLDSAKITSLSPMKQIDVDRSVILPNVTDNYSPTNKSTFPNDIQANSDEDLKYLVYINVDPTKLNTLLGSELNIKISAGNGREVTSSSASLGKRANDINWLQEIKCDPATFNPSNPSSCQELPAFTQAQNLFRSLYYNGTLISGTINIEDINEFVDVTYRIYDATPTGSTLTRFNGEWTLNGHRSTTYSTGQNAEAQVKANMKIEIEGYLTSLGYKNIKQLSSLDSGTKQGAIATWSFTGTVGRLAPGFRYTSPGGTGVDIPTNQQPAFFTQTAWKDYITNFVEHPGQDIKNELSFDLATQHNGMRIERIVIRGNTGTETGIVIPEIGFSKEYRNFNANDPWIAVDKFIFK